MVGVRGCSRQMDPSAQQLADAFGPRWEQVVGDQMDVVWWYQVVAIRVCSFRQNMCNFSCSKISLESSYLGVLTEYREAPVNLEDSWGGINHITSSWYLITPYLIVCGRKYAVPRVRRPGSVSCYLTVYWVSVVSGSVRWGEGSVPCSSCELLVGMR